MFTIPSGYAETRNQPDYTKTAKYVCPHCGWMGYVRMSFTNEVLSKCPHKNDSPVEEYR